QVVMANKELDLYNLTIGDSFLEAKVLKKNNDYEMDYSAGKFSIRTSFMREVATVDRGASEHQSSVYVSLPKEYLTSKITSYGGRFQYSIINRVNNRVITTAVPLPDVILIGKNFTLIHEHIEQPAINEDFDVAFRIVEKE